MSTGAPLNLPKPKATTNTGQDMIELGNSLQKINDAILGVHGRLTSLEGMTLITWASGDRIWHTKPAGFYYHGSTATGYPPSFGFIVHLPSAGGSQFMAQLFVGRNGMFRVRAFNNTESMAWNTIS